MQTSVIGFPRIGTLRELKFASEKYFKKEISEEELLQTGKELRAKHWNTQRQAGTISPVMTFHIMIWCWTQRFYSTSFPNATRN